MPPVTLLPAALRFAAPDVSASSFAVSVSNPAFNALTPAAAFGKSFVPLSSVESADATEAVPAFTFCAPAELQHQILH